MNELDHLPSFNPTWEEAAEIYISVLVNPLASDEATFSAKEDLLSMARDIDMLKAHIGKLQEALDEATNPQPKEK